MAIPLPKYRSQVKISGEGVAKTLDPSATIKAAGSEDALLADFITQAGGVASNYFEEKAKTIDKGLLADYEREKLETDARIITRSQDALLGRGEFEGNPLSYDQISETVVQQELNGLKDSLSQKNFNFNDNKIRVDSDYLNYENKINTQQLIANNQRAIEQSNLSQFNLLEDKEIVLDGLKLDYEKLNPASPEAIALKEKIDNLSLDIEEGYTDLERTTKVGTVEAKRQRNISGRFKSKIDIQYNNYLAEAINPFEFQENMDELTERITNDETLDSGQKQELIEDIQLKKTNVIRKAVQKTRDLDITLNRLITGDDVVEPKALDFLREQYEPIIGKEAVDELIIKSFTALDPSTKQFEKFNKAMEDFTSTGNFPKLIEDMLGAFEDPEESGLIKGNLYGNYIRELAVLALEDWVAQSANSDAAYNQVAQLLGIAPLKEGDVRVDLSKSYQFRIIRESIEMSERISVSKGKDSQQRFIHNIQDNMAKVIEFSQNNPNAKIEQIQELDRIINSGLAAELITSLVNEASGSTDTLNFANENSPQDFREKYNKLLAGDKYIDANGVLKVKEDDKSTIQQDPTDDEVKRNKELRDKIASRTGIKEIRR